MFRSPPPSGRVHRLLTIAMLLCSVGAVAPAGAAEVPTDAASEFPQPTIAPEVTGLDPLLVTAAGDGLALTVTDSAGNVGTYGLDPQTARDRTYAVDLNMPGAGVAPVNGMATVALTAAGATVLSSQVLLDRDPVAPALAATGSPHGATLVWSAVSGPGAITYRLERTTAGEPWSTLADGLTGTSYREPGLTPGTHRYRLTAAAMAAGGGVNRSQPAVASVHVAAPPEPPPPSSPPANADPFPRTPATLPDLATPVPARTVAVAGGIRRGIAERRQRRPATDLAAVANRPGIAPTFRVPLEAFAPWIARKPLAAGTASGAAAIGTGPLPVPVAPASMLVVEAVSPMAATQLGDVGAVLAMGLLAALPGVARRRRRVAYSGGGRSPVNT